MYTQSQLVGYFYICWGYYKAVLYPLVDVLKYVIAVFGIHIHVSNDILILYLFVGAAFARFDMYSSSPEGLAKSPQYIRIPNDALVHDDIIEGNRDSAFLVSLFKRHEWVKRYEWVGKFAKTYRAWIDRVFSITRSVTCVVAWPLVWLMFGSMAFTGGNAGYWATQILRYISVGTSLEGLKAVGLFVFFLLINAASPSLF